MTKLNTLTAAEAAYKNLVDQKAADDVMEKINEIGEVTLDSKTAIEAARAAYNALTPDQKPLVENYNVLTDAEAELARLEAEAKYEADLAAAAQVDEMIERLFPVNRYSGPAIRMARAAYDALTEDQKALVKHYDDLVKAEAEFAEIPPITPVGPSKPSKPSTPDTSKDNLPFTDVASGSWYYDGVKYACDNGLMNGTSANAFSPNADTTRSMIVTILARMEGVNTSGGATWYTAGRAWAMENGISDGTNMEGKITREQLAAMLYRYAKMKGYDVSASASLSGYTDASSVSGWAKEAMQWAVGSGLIQGSGNALTRRPMPPARRSPRSSCALRRASQSNPANGFSRRGGSSAPPFFIAEETNMEEARLTAYLFQKLLDAVFLTEHNMARQLGLSYKVLRRVQKAQRMTQKTRRCHGAAAAILCTQSDPIGPLPLRIPVRRKSPCDRKYSVTGGFFSL